MSREMNEKEKAAYKWALMQKSDSVSSRNARTLAEFIKRNLEVTVCMYCNSEIPRTQDAMLEHIQSCDKRPEKNLMEVFDKQVKEFDLFMALSVAWMGDAQRLHPDLVLPNIVLEWQQELLEDQHAQHTDSNTPTDSQAQEKS